MLSNFAILSNILLDSSFGILGVRLYLSFSSILLLDVFGGK